MKLGKKTDLNIEMDELIESKLSTFGTCGELLSLEKHVHTYTNVYLKTIDIVTREIHIEDN